MLFPIIISFHSYQFHVWVIDNFQINKILLTVFFCLSSGIYVFNSQKNIQFILVGIKNTGDKRIKVHAHTRTHRNSFNFLNQLF